MERERWDNQSHKWMQQSDPEKVEELAQLIKGGNPLSVSGLCHPNRLQIKTKWKKNWINTWTLSDNCKRYGIWRWTMILIIVGALGTISG